MGRKRSKPYRAKLKKSGGIRWYGEGRMVGSTRAPLGISGPVEKVLLEKFDEIVSRSARENGMR